MQCQNVQAIFPGLNVGLDNIQVPDICGNGIIPSIDNKYVFDPNHLKHTLYYLHKSYGDALFLQGPSGCGKTSLINQVAARLKWPVEEVTLSNRSSIMDLVGMATVQGNTMCYMYGSLAMSMMYGRILILNEIDTVNAGELTFLNDIIEGRPLNMVDNPGQKIKPHPCFRLVFTANTKGDGDSAGFYVGTRLFNQAFVDRLRFICFDYNVAHVERQILKIACPNLLEDTVNKLLQFVSEIRSNCLDAKELGQITSPLTTRALVKMARFVTDYSYVSVQEAVEIFFAGRFVDEQKEYVMRLCRDIFGNEPYYMHQRKNKANPVIGTYINKDAHEIAKNVAQDSVQDVVANDDESNTQEEVKSTTTKRRTRKKSV